MNEKIEKLKEVSKPYRPSNGTEGVWFEEKFCSKCEKDDPINGKMCETLGRLYMGYVEEIRETEEHCFCMNDTNFNIEEWEDELK